MYRSDSRNWKNARADFLHEVIFWSSSDKFKFGEVTYLTKLLRNSRIYIV